MIKRPATYTAAVTACYHTAVVDSGDRNAKTGYDEDTSVISGRVVDVIIKRPVKVTVDSSHRYLGSLGVTVKEGDGQRECRLLTESIGRRVPVDVDQLTYVTR